MISDAPSIILGFLHCMFWLAYEMPKFVDHERSHLNQDSLES